ncbi:MAG: hypothetical protein IJB97_10760, partial [Clostridia bacterium]|nr:hypothetical protein [Clostridia bacterium]
ANSSLNTRTKTKRLKRRPNQQQYTRVCERRQWPALQTESGQREQSPPFDRNQGYTPDRKNAIVTLTAESKTIEFFDALS